MDEPKKASYSFEGDRSANHPKPFFYVQPPVPPFYACQWHMNEPYGHQVFPGYNYHYGRSYMSPLVPYAYLQYPSYVMPHAMHPVDYRQVYDRNLPHSPASKITLHQQQNANITQKETACAGAQTESSDALNKLIECLDQLHAADNCHMSGSVSPLTEDSKCEGVSEKLGAKKDHAEEKQSVEKNNKQAFEETEKDELQYHEYKSDSSQIQFPSGIDQAKQKNIQNQGIVDTDGMEWAGYDVSQPSTHSSLTRCSSRKNLEIFQDLKNVEERDIPDELSCCILHLPFEKVLSSGVLGHSVTSSSLGSPLSYTYHPPKLAHERLSVLSPSLDELSSHDEVLSTDLDELDLFPPRIYTKRRLSEVASKAHGSELCILYPNRLTCTTCGSHTFKELTRSKTYSYKDFKDSDEGQDETARSSDQCPQSVPIKGLAARKSNLLLKQRSNSMQHREKMQKAHETLHSEHFHCEKCMSSPEKSCIHTYRARPERCSRLTTDQLIWENIGGSSRPKSYRAQPLPERPQRQEKSRFKSHMRPASRKNDAEEEVEDEEEEGQKIIQYHI